MPSFHDKIGQKFNRWTAVKPEHERRPSLNWEFLCDCGTRKVIRWHNVKRGESKSCGCYKAENASENGAKSKTHGWTGTAEHKCWVNIHQRCHNQSDKDYPNYGGRGIAVCDRWATFEAFIEDMGKKPSRSHSIDRRDVNGDYEPSNCRWATIKEQNRNRRDTIRVDALGMTGCLADFLKAGSREYNRAQELINKGISPAGAVYQILGM